VRKLFAAALAASLGVCGAGQGWADEAPAPRPLQVKTNQVVEAPSANQRLADAIAATLNQSLLLKDFRVTISVVDGDVDLAGTVHTQAQRTEVINLAQSVPGVQRVRDRLQVSSPDALRQVQGQPAAPPAVEPLPPLAIPPQGKQPLPKVIGGDAKPEPQNFNPFIPPPPQPGFGPPGFGPPPGAGGPPGLAMPPGGILEPMPLQGAPPGFPSANQPPPLPPYAWPTYAPYNNMSRVAYPNLYPYESFPFIGPFYPFPKVPLGWRSVTLTWSDGHWWLGRNATGHDWWRVRYW